MTLVEVLAPFGVTEDDFVEELSRDLAGSPDSSATRLTRSEESILREHGGITAPVGDEAFVRKAAPRWAASNLAEQTRESFSVDQTAALLMVDGSRVRHRVRDRALYAFKIGGGLRLPVWQFDSASVIPGLRAVLAALPPGLHPLEASGFMTTAETELSVDGEPTNPREWLIGGGAVGAVVELIEHLDTW